MIYYEFLEGGMRVEKEWHYGEPFPDLGAFEILSLQADGDELDLIRFRFKNIPIHAGRIVEWFGETAKFILLNMRHLNI